MNSAMNHSRPSIFAELDRGFNRLMQDVLARDTSGSGDPRMSLMEFDNRYVVECDLPGIRVEAISLQIEDDVLTISGKRPAVATDENARVLFSDRPASEFTRRVRLARDVDPSAVDAELSNGVLRLTVMKRAELQPRKIEIKRANGSD